MIYFLGFIGVLIILLMLYMTIKTRGRYPVYKLMLILWRVMRLKYFLSPQINKIKKEHGKLYITPETICFMDVLCQLRFRGLDFLDQRDIAVLYLVILDIPKDKTDKFFQIFLDWRENNGIENHDYIFDKYLKILGEEYHVHRKFSHSFYDFNLSMKRNDKFTSFLNYLIVEM
ncbi:hypothetical protein [Acinetobacter sp. YH01003]|uniref:hypothetical protein n=1 Tax=Acinetobacter sp. YH01003 TaxID=2601019 RepID=UPI0015D19CF5|nr:hypothetical protein [Acinetobacter sp. YH01003]